MGLLTARLRQEDLPELMDLPHPRRAMELCLTELARLNRLLGVRGLVWRLLLRFVRPGDTTLTVADVATGGADLPRTFTAWGRRRGLALGTIAVDRHSITASIARDRCAAVPEIRVLLGDASALPLADRSVDVALLTSSLHHLTRPDAVRALRELERVSRRGFVVTDLVRARGAYLGARALALLVLRSPLTRTDGPRSVLRSYTFEEARGLLAEAGLTGVEVSAHPLYRMALVKQRMTPVQETAPGEAG